VALIRASLQASWKFSISPQPRHLEHQRIDQGEADLDQMEGEDGSLLTLWPIRQQFSTASRENEAIDTVPLRNHIECFLDLLPESLVTEVFAKENLHL
jgi:hypothetical protein